MSTEYESQRSCIVDAATSEALEVARIARAPASGEPDYVSLTRTRILAGVLVAYEEGERDVARIRVTALRRSFWCWVNEPEGRASAKSETTFGRSA
jgi:hypothetical protein